MSNRVGEREPTGSPIGSRHRRARALVVAASCCAACGGGAADPASRVLRIGRPVTESLAPNTGSFPAVEATSHVYESLVRHDRELALEPSLAVEWEALSPDLWRLRLRRGVVFHDGTPFDAEAARDAIAAVLAEPEAQGRQWLGSVVEAKAAGELLLELKTQRPEPLLMQRLARFEIARRGPRGEWVGTGPYRVTRWEPGRVLELEAFEGHWAGTPDVRRVEFVPTPVREEMAALRAGRIDVVTLSATRAPAPIRVERVHSITRMFLWFAGAWDDGPNPLADRRVRLAIALAVDRARLSAAANADSAFAARQLVPSLIVGHVPDLPARESAVDEARRLLAEAGWPSGFDAPLLHVRGGARSTQAAGQLRSMLLEVGIRVEPRGVPMDQVLQAFAGRGAGLLLSPWTFDDGEAGSFLRDCVHSRTGGLGLFNPGSATSEMDAGIEAALAELDPLARQASYQELIRAAEDLVPVVPLFDHAAYFGVAPGWRWKPRVDTLILAQEFEVER